MPLGFKRNQLKPRYDVSAISEDNWHTYSGNKTKEILFHHLPDADEVKTSWLLNAGAGVYEVCIGSWREVSVDLFIAPIQNRKYAVCSSIEKLPFQSSIFGGIVCVGEVLAYCDPAMAITEFARVLAPSGLFICDFGNSRSFRYWFRKPYRRAADLVTDLYNGTPEQTWIYSPDYISSILLSSGFEIKARIGIHTWSALARRLGASIPTALFLQHHLEWLRLPNAWADITTIVASRVSTET